MQFKPGSIFEAASTILTVSENAAMDRLAHARAAMKKGKEYEAQYVALINSIKTAIPWTKKPTKGTSSALSEYVGQIGVNQLSFSFHAPSKYSYAYYFVGALVSTAGEYGNLEDFGVKPDILTYDELNDDHIKQNLADFKKTIELAKKIDPKKPIVKSKKK